MQFRESEICQNVEKWLSSEVVFFSFFFFAFVFYQKSPALIGK